MTIDEAINELQDQRAFHLLQKEPNHADADQLGVEALKREDYCRKHQPYLTFGLLPGETEE